MGTALTTRAFQVHAADNVATLLGDATEGSVVSIIGQTEQSAFVVREPIAMGHKIALLPIHEDESIYKYGVVIGVATCKIEPGRWVHLHNCRSQIDERSSSLDLYTGIPKAAHHE